MKGEVEEKVNTRYEIQLTIKRLKSSGGHTQRERVRAIKCEIVWPHKMTHKANIAAYKTLLHMVLLCHICL